MSRERQPGELLGPYRIVTVLGRGGMGVVYEGQDERTRARVAIKVLGAQVANDLVALRRFRREAKGARLAHPNVATLVDEGTEHGAPYLVFELVTGGTLRDVIRARGALPWREALPYAIGIARGLAAIHAAGLMHRDLKPENVLIDAAGRPRITDFGLVGETREHALTFAGGLTKTGELMGTVDYMAPEQADGQHVDHKADLHALGAILHDLLLGRPPFEGTGVAVLQKLLTQSPRSLRATDRSIPRDLDALVLRLLAKEPAERPDAASVADALEAMLSGGASGASRLLPWVVGVFVLVALGTSVALAVVGSRRRSSADPPPSAPPSPRVDPLARAVREGCTLARVSGERAGHDGAVSTVVVLPDGAFVSAGADGTVRRWGPRGEEARLATGRGDRVSIAATSDGLSIVAGGSGGAMLLDAACLRVVRPLDARPVLRVATAYGQRTALLAHEGELFAEDVDTNAVACRWKLGGDVTAMAAIGGTRLVLAGLTSQDPVECLHVVSGKSAGAPPDLIGRRRSLASADASFVAGANERDVVLLQMRGSDSRLLRTVEVPADDAVAAVALSRDARSLATLTERGVVLVSDVTTGARLARIDLAPTGDAARSVAFGRDGRTLVVGTQRGAVLEASLTAR